MWIWLVVAVLAAIGEAVTYDLWLASIAVAALVTALVTVLVPIGVVQVGIFAALALVGILVVRPVVKHALGITPATETFGPVTHRHLAGKRGVVVRRVSQAGGQIRIGQGEFWTARPYEPDEMFEEGEPVEVVLVDGITALVERPPSLESKLGAIPLSAPGQKGTE